MKRPAFWAPAALALVFASGGQPAQATIEPAMPYDFNGDGYADLAVGVPYENHPSGAVNVLYGSAAGLTAAGDQYWTLDTPGIKGVNDHYTYFGSSLASGDFDRDGWADLAVGSDGDVRPGAVNVLYGSPSGLGEARDQRWTRATLGIAFDDYDAFGEALATGDFDSDGYPDLAVGDAYAQDEDRADVTILFGSPAGLTAVGALTLDAATTTPAAVIGQLHYGLALVVGDLDANGHDDLVIGVPFGAIEGDRPVAGLAGFVNVIYGDADGLDIAGAEAWSQDSPGIADESELWLDDHGTGLDEDFGAVLAVGDFDGDGADDLAAGSPIETPGCACQGQPERWIGSVSVLYGSTAGLTAEGNQVWHQDVPGMPGSAEDWDHFGAALAAGDLNGDGRDDLAVGVPGERFGSRGAGSVAVILGSPTGLSSAGSTTWTQDSSGVPGTAESEDDFGYSLAIHDHGRSAAGDLSVGVPTEGVGPIFHAGAVNILYGSASGPTGRNAQCWHQDSAGIKGVAERMDDFGSTLGR